MWCKRLDADTFTDSRVIKPAEQFVPVKINAETNKSVAKKFKVHGYPMVVFADGHGKPVGKIRGYLPPEPFAAKMAEVLRVHRELPQMEATYEANPTDLATGGLLAAAYAVRGNANKAKKLVRAAEKIDPTNEQGHLTEAYMAIADAYAEKDDNRNAAKFYARAAASAKEALVVVDARLGAAMACFQDRMRLKAGSKGRRKKLEQAKHEVDTLLAMADVPEDRLERAKGLQDAIDKARAKEGKN